MDTLCGMGEAMVHTCNYLKGNISTNEPLKQNSKFNVDVTRKEGGKYTIDCMLMTQTPYFRGSISKIVLRADAVTVFQ